MRGRKEAGQGSGRPRDPIEPSPFWRRSGAQRDTVRTGKGKRAGPTAAQRTGPGRSGPKRACRAKDAPEKPILRPPWSLGGKAAPHPPSLIAFRPTSSYEAAVPAPRPPFGSCCEGPAPGAGGAGVAHADDEEAQLAPRASARPPARPRRDQRPRLTAASSESNLNGDGGGGSKKVRRAGGGQKIV